MSSQPPFTPPGGTPPGGIPPYDPRTQWRVYREQQRAAWRAQREAWKAQRHAWKAGYGSAYGPHVPSVVGPIILVGIGIVGLLIYSGRIAPSNFWSWYGHWWPLLLIAAGLALLGEWALDLRRTGFESRRHCLLRQRPQPGIALDSAHRRFRCAADGFSRCLRLDEPGHSWRRLRRLTGYICPDFPVRDIGAGSAANLRGQPAQ